MVKFLSLFIITLLAFFQANSQTTDTYTSGTTVWTVPACVNTVTVRAWGGGGAGGGARSTDRNGGGGGGGAYSTVNYAVTPGQQLSIVVGVGGAGVAANTGNPGTASTVTIVSGPLICSAAPGAGGTMGANASSSGNGGNGGATATNVPAGAGFAGGRGGNSNPTTTTSDQSGAGGGGAGTTAAGSNGANNGGAGGAGGAVGGGTGGAGITTTSNSGSPGNPGNAIGGGGGGATCYNTGTRAGGNGARGQVEITYTAGTPAGITGPTDPCYNTTQNYSISNPGATSFTWTVPDGWTILSGAGTNTISVLVGIGGGDISVLPVNPICPVSSAILLPVTVCAASVPAPNQIYSAAGTYNWTVPACVTNVIVQAWGGGGGGGGVASYIVGTGGNEACSGGGGGGGGGFTSRVYNVTPGQVYTIVVGAGGVAGVGVSGGTIDVVCCNGGTGGNSTFSGPATVGPGTLTAFGGSGGVGAKTYNNNCGCHEGFNGTGGAGGTNIGTNGSVSYVGGNGAMGRHSASCFDQSGGGGAGAGTTSNGGTATALTGCPVGSRAGGVGGASSGGNGADGRLGTICTSCAPNYASIAGNAIGGGGSGALTHVNDWSNTWVLRNGGVGARGEVRLTFFDCPLPINLTNFSGFALNQSNKLTWEVETTNDLQSFVLEKSIDGSQWSKVNEIIEKKSSNEFFTMDNNCASDEITYYRLTSIEMSGVEHKYNRIVEIYRNINNIEVVKTVNLLGQEVASDYKGVVFKYLKNGQIERIIQE